MKTIIAGSRGITLYEEVLMAVSGCGWGITQVISGGARGVDKLGERWAKENNIPLLVMPANWKKYGSGAGHIRNVDMANEADALIAIWDGLSPGTANMINIAKKKNLKVYVQLNK